MQIDPQAWRAAGCSQSGLRRSAEDLVVHVFGGRTETSTFPPSSPVITIVPGFAPRYLRSAGLLSLIGWHDQREIRVGRCFQPNVEERFLYEFSHEVTHLCADNTNWKHENQWFEEALAEAVSLFALRQFGHRTASYSDYEKFCRYPVNSSAAALLEHLRKFEQQMRKDPAYTEGGFRVWNHPFTIAFTDLLDVQQGDWLPYVPYLNACQKFNPLTSLSTYLKNWLNCIPSHMFPLSLDFLRLINLFIKDSENTKHEL